MKSIALVMLAATAFAARAGTEDFDATKLGAVRDGWEAGVTGFGPKWAVRDNE